MYHDYIIHYTNKACPYPAQVFEELVRAGSRAEAVTEFKSYWNNMYHKRGMVKIVTAKHDPDCYTCFAINREEASA